MILYLILAIAATAPIIAFGAGMTFEDALHREGLTWLAVAELVAICATLAMAAHIGGAWA